MIAHKGQEKSLAPTCVENATCGIYIDEPIGLLNDDLPSLIGSLMGVLTGLFVGLFAAIFVVEAEAPFFFSFASLAAGVALVDADADMDALFFMLLDKGAAFVDAEADEDALLFMLLVAGAAFVDAGAGADVLFFMPLPVWLAAGAALMTPPLASLKEVFVGVLETAPLLFVAPTLEAATRELKLDVVATGGASMSPFSPSSAFCLGTSSIAELKSTCPMANPPTAPASSSTR